MTIIFDVEELRALKREHPEWVILLGDKNKNPQTLIGRYKEIRTQTLEDLEVLIKKIENSPDEAWNYGPRTALNNLLCLDWDWEFLAYSWIQKFGERVKTETYRTPNKGYRMLYQTTERENDSPFKQSLHMEFENGGYVAIGGHAIDEEGCKASYEKIGNYPIKTDNTIIADTKEFLKEQVDRYDFLGYNCIKTQIGKKKHINLNHEQRLAVLQFMLSNELTDQEIHDFFKTVYDKNGRDYDRNTTQSQIESGRNFKERGGKPHPCKPKTREDGKVSIPLYQIFSVDTEDCKKCSRHKTPKKQEEKDNAVYTTFLETSTGQLCEQAFNGNQIYFLVYDPKNGNIEQQNTVNDNDKVYKPIESPEVFNGTVLFPSAVMEYGTDENLYLDIINFLNYWHESPNIEERDLDAYYIFKTYMKDLLPQVCYRRNLAPYGQGKSAWLEAVGYITYKPMILAGSDTAKSLVRRLDLWRGTSLIDEADFSDSTVYSFIIKILNIGYDRKTGWYHKCEEDDPKATVPFNVYGCKLLATREEFDDKALESRCLTFQGGENKIPKPLFRDEQFSKESQILRNKLILWKFRNYAKFKEEVKKLEDPKLPQEVYGEINLKRRIQQVLLPIYLVSGSRIKDKIVTLAQRIQHQLNEADPEYENILKVKAALITLTDAYNEEPTKPKEAQNREESSDCDSSLTVIPSAMREHMQISFKAMVEQVFHNEYGANNDLTSKHRTSLNRRLSKIVRQHLHIPVTIDDKRGRWLILPTSWLEVWKKEKILRREEEKEFMRKKGALEITVKDTSQSTLPNEPTGKEPQNEAELIPVGINVFKCSNCACEFSSDADWQLHYQRVHGGASHG